MNDKIYIIKYGDSLSRIAIKLGVSLLELLEVNPVLKSNFNNVKIGHKLNIPSSSPNIVNKK